MFTEVTTAQRETRSTADVGRTEWQTITGKTKTGPHTMQLDKNVYQTTRFHIPQE